MRATVQAMRSPETREIGEHTFEVTPLGFTAGRKLFVRLSRAFGPAIGHLSTGRPQDLAAALSSALEGLSDEDLNHVSEIFGETTRVVQGAKMPYLSKDLRETLFAGRILLFFQWIAFALEVNYADFFGEFKKARDPDKAAKTPQNSAE